MIQDSLLYERKKKRKQNTMIRIFKQMFMNHFSPDIIPGYPLIFLLMILLHFSYCPVNASIQRCNLNDDFISEPARSGACVKPFSDDRIDRPIIPFDKT